MIEREKGIKKIKMWKKKNDNPHVTMSCHKICKKMLQIGYGLSVFGLEDDLKTLNLVLTIQLLSLCLWRTFSLAI